MSERDNRTIIESARLVLHHSGLPLSFWAEATQTATYVLNRPSTRLHAAHNSFRALVWLEALTGTFEVEHLKVFCCSASSFVPIALSAET